MTLLELLMALAISAVIMVPLLGWTYMGFTSRQTIEDRSSDNLNMSLVSAWFTSDVQAATQVVIGGPDCPGGDGAAVLGDPARQVLVSIDAARPDGSGIVRTAYTVSPSTDRPDGSDVWRRRCDLATPATPTDANTIAWGVFKPVATDTWQATVSCQPRGGRGDDPCGVVSVTLRGRTHEVIELTATRRVGDPL